LIGDLLIRDGFFVKTIVKKWVVEKEATTTGGLARRENDRGGNIYPIGAEKAGELWGNS